MKTKTVGTLLIAGLVVLSAMVVFATPAMAYTDEEFENAPPIAELEPDDRYPSPPEGETREDPKWYGAITNVNTGDPMPGLSVKLYKDVWFFGWYLGLRHLGSDITNEYGKYSINNRWVWPEGQYYLRISDGTTTETYPKYLYWRWGHNDYTWTGRPEYIWTYLWNQTSEIPEFSTIALPVASILGLLFFFKYRKRRKEE